MWILLIIILNQPYHVATVDILGTYVKKEECIKAQQRAKSIGTPQKSSFGCIKILGVKRMNSVSRETKEEI
jgi:hypothetical protein